MPTTTYPNSTLTSASCRAAGRRVRAGAPEVATLTVELPIGRCVVAAGEYGLLSVRLLSDAAPGPVSGSQAATGAPPAEALATAQAAAEQLIGYFRGSQRCFDLPLDLSGQTDFQQRVLECCALIPYGETLTYGELALRAGAPRAARAVGQVMAHNCLLLVVPCHRVLAGGGGLGGYGHGLEVKARLLRMEREGRSWDGA